MNRQRMEVVRDHLVNHVIPWLGFNMGDYVNKASESLPDRLNGCKTVACIAGTAQVFAYLEEKPDAKEEDINGFFYLPNAGKWLELTQDEEDRLFMGHFNRWGLSHIPVQAAIDTINRFLETTEVVWDRQVLLEAWNEASNDGWSECGDVLTEEEDTKLLWINDDEVDRYDVMDHGNELERLFHISRWME